MCFDDLATQGKTQSCAGLFGRIEWQQSALHDFIADAVNDSRLPDIIRDWDHLESYLVCRRASWQAVEAGRTVWDRYQSTLPH